MGRTWPVALAASVVGIAGCGDGTDDTASTTPSTASRPPVRSAEHDARAAEAHARPTEPDGTPIPIEPQGEEPNRGTPGAQEATGGKVDIPIRDGRFTQPRMRVTASQIVVWTNEDGTPHTVRAIAARLPRSGLIPAGGRFEFTPLEPGRIRYHCTVHPEMTGVLVIKPRTDTGR